ncbi:permease [Desulforamulus aquiferis]|uniref:Permease n=1 Tax=Desulforamulus aquiferis TaxID=1397668 RepID=A0AAW7ZH48_9FIRM|nr:permease [Desulforamulus aquiferis]MDO7788617.1 permease [Desulforamulus aquiferis]
MARLSFIKLLFIITAICLIISWVKDRQRTIKALKIAQKSFMNLLPSILGIIGILGFSLAVLPTETIKTLFSDQSFLGLVLVSLVGSITLMPAFVAFPLAGSLLQAGASVTAVACFCTTLLMVGILTAPAEIKYFGKSFTLSRNILGFGFALIIGLLMGVMV